MIASTLVRTVRYSQLSRGQKALLYGGLALVGTLAIATDPAAAQYDPPELDASADGDVTTDSITVAYDKMDREEM